MRSAIVRIDESRVEVELIDLVIFRPEALGWHFRYPQGFLETTQTQFAHALNPCGVNKEQLLSFGADGQSHH